MDAPLLCGALRFSRTKMLPSGLEGGRGLFHQHTPVRRVFSHDCILGLLFDRLCGVLDIVANKVVICTDNAFVAGVSTIC